MSHDLTPAEEEAITKGARHVKIQVPAREPWTLVLVGYRSGKRILKLQHPGAPSEMWLPSPLPNGPRRVLARRVELDAANRVAYYIAGRLELKSEIEARAAAGQKEFPEVGRKRGRR